MVGGVNTIPISVWYGVGRVTPKLSIEKWEKDIKTIRETGIKFLRGWVNWGVVESKPGYYNFDEVDRLLNLAEKNNMKVILQVYIEFAPDWLVKENPDAIFISESDHKIFPQGSPGLCLDHPRVREKAEEFLTKLALHVKDNLTFYGWDVWSEPQLIQWVYFPHVRPGIFCYCPYSIQKFRQWLKNKYGNIENLNEAWHRSFIDINDVMPPKYVVLHFATENLDWLSFNIEKLREYLKWRVETIRKTGDKHVISSHAPIPSPFLNPLYGFPDDWEMAKEVDVWGTSLYPKHALHIHDPTSIALILDITRCASASNKKSYWIGEMQGGQGVGGLELIEPVTAEDITIWSWEAIAHDAKGINYYHWYPMMWGFEATGYGLANFDGSLNEKCEAVGKFAKIISTNEELFYNIQSLPAEVAILYNIDAYKALWVANITSVEVLTKSIMGIYRIFYEENIPIDIIHNENIIKEDIIDKKYKIIFLPFSYVLSEKLCKGLMNFIQKGGTVIADARFGWMKDDGWVDEEIPALGMSKIFKAKEKYCKSIDKASIVITNRNKLLSSLNIGEIITGTFYKQEFDVFEGGIVLAKHSDSKAPAIVYGRYGDGKAILIGTNVGKSYEDFRDENLKKLLLNIADSVGIKRQIKLYGTPKKYFIEARILRGRRDSDPSVLILINHSNEYLSPIVNIDIERKVKKVKDIITGEEYDVKLHEKELELSLKIKPKQVIVAFIEFS
ncbi:MAG: beta-galactosidase [Candidatus Micrarchaeia archaeon]